MSRSEACSAFPTVRRSPARFTRKVAYWEIGNRVGRLVCKEPAEDDGWFSAPACITLEEGQLDRNGVLVVTARYCHAIDNGQSYVVIERPAVGMVRIVKPFHQTIELLHLAADRAAAELWLEEHPDPDVSFEEVTADEVGADVVEGRTAV